MARSGIILLFLIALALNARDPSPTPLMRVAEPETAKTRHVVTVTGINLENKSGCRSVLNKTEPTISK